MRYVLERALRFWGIALSSLNTALGVVLLVAALLPLDRWLPAPIVGLVVRLACGVVAAGILLIYAPARAMREVEENFYRWHLNARADRAHRVFRRLLNESREVWIEPRESLPARLHELDVKIRRALAEHCHPLSDEMYYVQTRHAGSDRGDFRIPVGALGDTQEFLWRLLEDLEQEPSRRLKPNP